jgi:DNA invertase Pin-like site-specific DNA recombinase
MSKTTILYARLSRDDGEDGVSNSIINQQKLLEEYAERNGLIPFSFICDDGFSGTNWNRPGWQELMAKVEADEVSTVVVKDSSRLGRDYLRVGLFRETLHEKGVRLIAVNDGIDSFHSDDDFTPFREIMAEWYARDCSRKVKSVFRQKGMSGARLHKFPLYGYKKADDSIKNSPWIVDEEAAIIVQRIFAEVIAGRSVGQIARQLSAEKVESPSYHLAQLGTGNHKNKEFADPYLWFNSSVSDILKKVEYMGHTCNFKTVSKSFKSKKRYKNDPDNIMIFENTHEALVDSETWELANKIWNAAKRHYDKVTDEAHVLTGLVFCGTCGNKHHHQRSSPGAKQSANSYICGKYRKSKADSCTPHRINVHVLEELILVTLRHVATYALKNPKEFKQKVAEMFAANHDGEVKAQKKRLVICERRVVELDKLIKRLFEEHTLGNMQGKRFDSLSAEYESEQELLETEIAELQLAVDSYIDSSERADKFLALAKRHTDFSEFTPQLLNEFVQRVVVHERADKRCQHTNQKIEIYLNFIDDFIVATESQAVYPDDNLSRTPNRRQYHHDYYHRRKDNGGQPLTPPDNRSSEEIEAEKIRQQRLYNREWQRKRRARLKAEREAAEQSA